MYFKLFSQRINELVKKFDDENRLGQNRYLD